jgi:mRNA-degrading endonuclease RelE of RelBE toxin-antitoxin system
MNGGHDQDPERAWSLGYAGRAEKDIARLDRPTRQRVLASLVELSLDPAAGQLRKLTGRSEHRLRVGEWRVLVELSQTTHTIIVKRVLPRGRAYDR